MDFGASGLTFECLLTRMEGSTLVLTLNRPDARNAINWTMEQELWEALAAAQRIDAVRAVVLNGAGEMFSAGHDLKQVAKEARDGGPKVDGEWWARQTTMLPSWNFTKPFIAAVHGFVGPYANGILLTADLVIAAHGTKFSFEHSRTGVGRPWGPYALMYFMFPPRVIYKLWALGGWMDAEQAQQLHYVQRVVERDEVDDVASALGRAVLTDRFGRLRAHQEGHARDVRGHGLARDGRDRPKAHGATQRRGNREVDRVQQDVEARRRQGGTRAA